MTDIRIIVRTETDAGFGRPYMRFAADVAYMGEDGKLRNPVWESYGTGELGMAPYDSLHVRAQSDGADWYGWSLEYGQPFSVDLRRAESMVKTLRRLGKRMDTVAARYGAPQSLADYLARVADALGATGAAPYGIPDRTSACSDGYFRWMSIDTLRYRLASELESFRKIAAA